MEIKIDICNSEEQAKSKAELLNNELNTFPVYFFQSDTSGEKTYEEFYTEKEALDLNQFENLGVIKNSFKRDMREIDKIFKNLEILFSQESASKHEIVNVLNKYLSTFKHIETGKGLDQKM